MPATSLGKLGEWDLCTTYFLQLQVKLQCSRNKKAVFKWYLQLGELSGSNCGAQIDEMTTQVCNPYVKPWGLHVFGNFLDFRKVTQYTRSMLHDTPVGPGDTWSSHTLPFPQQNCHSHHVGANKTISGLLLVQVRFCHQMSCLNFPE